MSKQKQQPATKTASTTPPKGNGAITRTERDQKAHEASVEQIRQETHGYWRTDKENAAAVWIPAELDSIGAEVRREMDQLGREASVDLIRAEMQPASTRYVRESAGVDQATIDLIMAEHRAGTKSIAYGDVSDGTDSTLKPHPRQAEIDALMRRRGLPEGFKP